MAVVASGSTATDQANALGRVVVTISLEPVSKHLVLWRNISGTLRHKVRLPCAERPQG
jgi:hypothetical protein